MSDEAHDLVLSEEPELLDGHNTPREIEDENLAFVNELAQDCERATDPELLSELDDEDDRDKDPSFEEKRQRLKEFFSERVKSGSWPKTTMPRKGKDREFDELLQQLQLHENRTYAARRWFFFKQEKGYDQPVISSNVQYNNQIFKRDIASYQSAKNTTIPKMTIRGLETVAFTGISNEEREEYMSKIDSEWSHQVMFRSIEDLTYQYAVCISGLRHYSVTTKALNFEHYKVSTNRRQFILVFYKEKVFSPSYKMNIFLRSLHSQLCRSWSVAMNYKRPNMQIKISEVDLEAAIRTSKDDVAYVAGYLLCRMNNTKLLQSNDASIMAEFIRHNSQSQESAKANGIPTAAIQYREKKQGSLYRPGGNWFYFVCLMEGLYIMNLTPKNMLKHSGSLLVEIDNAIRTSPQLRAAFIQCFPRTFAQHEKVRTWRVYYLVLLPCFKMLKGGDYLRLQRQHKQMKEVSKGVDTRMGLHIASEVAKGKSTGAGNRSTT